MTHIDQINIKTNRETKLILFDKYFKIIKYDSIYNINPIHMKKMINIL